MNGRVLAVPQHRAEVEQCRRRLALRPRAAARHAKGHHERGEHRPQRTVGERGLPAVCRADQAADENGKARADAEARGVEADRPRLHWPFKPVREHLESRHVAPAQAGSDQELEEERAREPADQQHEARRAHARYQARGEIDPPRIHAVGKAGEDRRGRHVAGVVDAAHQPCFGIGKRPLALQHGKQRGVRREAGHAENFRPTHQETEPDGCKPGICRTHADIFIEIVQ